MHGIEDNMSKWIIDTDTGTEMLRCETCGSRIIAEHYRKAVGLRGYDYCPYCGAEKERPKEIQERIDFMTNQLKWK